MLKFTGHPLVDVGAATIAAFDTENRIHPEQVTEELLDRFTDYISTKYGEEPFASYIRLLFLNSPYFNAGAEKREQFINTVVRAYKNHLEPLDECCAFCLNPATHRVFRQHVSLLGGEQSFNFFAEGRKGLPICPICLVSIQAYPLGSAKCGGKAKALIVHSPNPDLVYEFARRFSLNNRNQAGLSQEIRFPKTMVIEILLDIEKELRRRKEDVDAITAYRLTNYGTDADVEINHLPANNIRFVYIARSGKYKSAWEAIVERAWEIEEKPKQKRQPKKKTAKEAQSKKKKLKQLVGRQNFFYEELFDLPENAQRFLRTYFLRVRRVGVKGIRDTDPRQKYSPIDDADIVSWDITSLFLREVMNMDKVRINAVRDLGDKLAEYVQTQDARLFSKIFNARRYKDLSLELLKANKATVQVGKPPLFSFDQFVDIFEESEEMPRADWSLARDLLLVRIIEQLHAANWWPTHKPELEEAMRDVAPLD
jgi:CRISPR-associated protein Cst1